MTRSRYRLSFSVLLLFPVSLLFILSARSARAQATFVRIDAPGGGTGEGQGTYPVAINSSGVIVGYFTDSAGVEHGFIRATDGTFTTVDDPPGTYTQLTAINSLGLVAGNGTNDLGFVRYRSGNIGPLAVAGAQCVVPVAMNDAGQIAGIACRDFPIERGFVWTHGSSIVFTVPGAGSFVQVAGLNSSGTIAGTCNSARDQYSSQAFVRDSAGNVTTFSATSSTKYTYATGINSSGQIAGYYATGSGNDVQPLLRNTDGTITLITIAGYYQAEATGINDSGTIVGTANTDTYETAFEYDTAGNLTLLVIPFSNVAGATGVAINPSGQVIGRYYDSAFAVHGWLMVP